MRPVYFLPLALLLSLTSCSVLVTADLADCHKKDFAAALDAITPQAQKGYAQAQYCLGNMYVAGEGVPQE